MGRRNWGTSSVVVLSDMKEGRRWRSHGGWVLAGDGERRLPFVVVLGGNGFGDQKIGYKEEDVLHWFRMVAETGRWPKMEDSQN
jgi:hypothetical protein